jgi:hypothetical protein
VADLPDNVNSVNAQAGCIAVARQEREQRQRHLARFLELPENSGFKVLIPLLPPDYRPLVDALVQENNELLIRVQQRARQNHLMLSHCVELMQQLINSIFPGVSPTTYDGSGHVPVAAVSTRSLYQAVG